MERQNIFYLRWTPIPLYAGRGCLVQAEVLRLKKDLKGEQNAIEISHGLPFVEYEIHRQLINKMKVKTNRFLAFI